MKKLITLLLVAVMSLSLVACAQNNNEQQTNTDGAKAIGEMVSTDILEVTVNDAALSYYATAAAVPSENSGFYTANKGSTLVCVDFTLTNTDRSSLDTRDWIIRFDVKQGDNEERVSNADGTGSFVFDIYGMPISVNGGDFTANSTLNAIINAGDTVRIKYVALVGFDADLSEPFELIVKLATSEKDCDSGETFIYEIQ